MSEEQNIDQPADDRQQATENENISEENIQPPLLNKQHEENMEVHHAHHSTHKRNGLIICWNSLCFFLRCS